ncbi:hypothetical protein NP493_1621g00019 [Ridgeia piscesae]|uniref:Chitin-binding type-2 domain-containing protein n=1 Tax=Ridgeia piscesae TaxID=27915 RepID=A0AAD9JXE6_RIDPI|nr:hypothetical protein NP493_1621g00019 [Ridgeia piscesae]
MKLLVVLTVFVVVLAYTAATDPPRPRDPPRRPPATNNDQFVCSGCVESCERKRDGLYPAKCTYDCRNYVECEGGKARRRHCRNGMFFDSERRECIRGCPTGSNGIIDCYDRPDGHWQHCCYCDLYATCANRGMFFHRRCEVGGTVWDDKEHKCLGKSCTCEREHRFYPLKTIVTP